ncbi:MAG: hypothetical protein QM655_14945 [Nocardioidaceae bacterium]
MNSAIKDWADWAVSQGWTVKDDTKGYTRFFDPEGTYVGYYPATPSNPVRRMADLKVALKKGRTSDSAALEEGLESGPQQAEGRSVMTTWAITATLPIEPDEDRLVALDEQLDATVSYAPGHGVAVVLYVEDPDPLSAAESARTMLVSAVGVEPVGYEVMTEQKYLARADEPTLPVLVSAPEVGEMLGGISRQRVHQLTRLAAFPEPLVRLRTGPIWDARAVQRFAREWERKPGRPAKASA